MNSKTLKEKLELHKKFVNGDEGGERLDLSGANLTEAILEGADLTGANFIRANLTEAILRGADLRGTILIGANLEGADLEGAILRGADLREANLTGANLDFSALPLWCGGLNFKIDERIAKQLVYHVINLMQTSEIDTSKIFKKAVFEWLETSHLVTKHELLILQIKEDENECG